MPIPKTAHSEARSVVDPGSCRAPALVVAHPGHELRVHAWMEMARPMVCVLTDGSGSTGEGRLESTSRVLERTEARRGPVYGRMSDREVYAAIMDHDLRLFCDLADELCAALLGHGADCVVGDAVEGYNPSHDVCRLVINAAVRMASRVQGAPLPNYDFVLVGAPDECPEALRDATFRLSLDDDALSRKLEAARGYPEMAGEVEAALARFGVTPFRLECLRPVDIEDRTGWTAEEPPFYERHGEKRVAAGVYDRVLRFREHVLPVAEALWDHSTRGA
ncbi:MAG TPA: hypothetical protein VHG28_13020 [Longimicrobiaceae bacterium]|nr:hypothetical protein [Longimicrobiaceae bacterium]